ncbi:polycystic kidney disease protein 1-like 2 [Lingula anatina]|uniref:Polycystic kidney disease protein 1-like 2 n=1 Tax=Lingula anatina TaxID=7574 RepID=A0A1S3HMM3_LINAN|nr:polycystic kidney disease protein 1-like 2 [Lingula anatina]|eukprot:XP_013386761.2 polycystic kidney disease protein 1-like 2 [Lingula anatina]
MILKVLRFVPIQVLVVVTFINTYAYGACPTMNVDPDLDWCISDYETDYFAARTACNALCGFLPESSNPGDLSDFAYDLLIGNSLSTGQRAWIGISSSGGGGWVYDSGTSVTDNGKWDVGYTGSTTAPSGECYAAKSDENMAWSQHNCTEDGYYICFQYKSPSFCSAPQTIPNATWTATAGVNCSNLCCNEYANVTYTCDNGYILTGLNSSTIQCVGGSYSEDVSTGYCEEPPTQAPPVNCSALQAAYLEGTIDYGNYTEFCNDTLPDSTTVRETTTETMTTVAETTEISTATTELSTATTDFSTTNEVTTMETPTTTVATAETTSETTNESLTTTANMATTVSSILTSLNASALTSPEAVSGAVAAVTNATSSTASELQQARDVVVTAISSTISSVNDAAGLNNLASSLSSITSASADTITEDTMDKSVLAAEAITLKLSSANISTAELTTISIEVVNSISNVMDNTLTDSGNETANETAGKTARAEKAVQVLNTVVDTIIDTLNETSPPVIISNALVDIIAQRVGGSQAGVQNFTTTAVQVSVPGNLETNSSVDVKLMYLKRNPFTASSGGENLTTGLLQFEMKTATGELVPLGSSQVEAEMTVPMTFAEAIASLVNMTTDRGVSQVLTVDNSAIYVVVTLPTSLNLVVLGKVGGEATKQSYDFKYSTSSVIESRDERVNLTTTFVNGSLEMFIPQSTIDGVSTLGISVFLGTASSAQTTGTSRRRLLATVADSNVTILSTAIKPSFYNSSSKTWGTSSGLQISGASQSSKIIFKSNFFGSFAAGLFIPPNTIDFDKVFGNFGALLAQSPHVLILMCSIVALYFLLLIWARRKDKQDMLMWTHHHVLENERMDHQHFLISVFTGSKSPKDTTVVPFVILYGTEGKTRPKVLLDMHRKTYQKGSVYNFVLSTPRTLGKLTHLHVWHCDLDSKADWFLDRVIVYDVQRKERSLFLCNQWLSLDKGSGQTDHLLSAADDGSLEDFNFLLKNNASQNLFDDHLWFSVAKRPTPSRLSRVQRLTACLAVLFLCMISNAMFYTESEDTANGIVIGPIVISFRQVYVGLISSLLVVPPTFVILEIFRRSKPKTTSRTIFPYTKTHAPKEEVKHPSTSTISKENGEYYEAVEKALLICQNYKVKHDKLEFKNQVSHFGEKGVVADDIKSPPEATTAPSGKKSRKPLRFPWWAIVFGYMLSFLAIATSAFFVLLYSLDWGATKSSNWLLSMFFAFTESVIIVQPLKVIAVAVVMSMILRMSGDGETEDDVVIADHELLPRGYPIPKPPFIPVGDTTIDYASEERKRLRRKHDAQLSGSLREIFIHIIYLILLIFICFANRDKNFFLQNEALRNSLDQYETSSNSVSRFEAIFAWLSDRILPIVFPTVDYNNDALDTYDQQFMKDIYGLRLGPLRIRQKRVVDELCTADFPLKMSFNSCNSDYHVLKQDKKSYEPAWEVPTANSTGAPTLGFNYTTPDGDKDMAATGMFATYEGGGYFVEINSLSQGTSVLATLKADSWIDRLTRAIFVEFTINNMNVNVFSMVRIKVELPVVGGIFTTRELVSFRPYPYVNPFDFVLLVIQVIWALVVFYLLVKEVIKMVKTGVQYFRELWHYVELLDLIFAVTSMVCFVLRTVYIIRSVEDVKNNQGRFVGFDIVANWDYGYSITIAFSLFLATLQLFRPLSFNKQLAILRASLSRSSIYLFTYGLIIVIILTSFGIGTHLLSGATLESFRTFGAALFNLCGVMLAVLDYEDVVPEDTLLLKVFFMMFAMVMNFLIINMFISVINDTLYEIKLDDSKQDYDKELADHLTMKIDTWFRSLFKKKPKQQQVRPERKYSMKMGAEETPAITVTSPNEQTRDISPGHVLPKESKLYLEMSSETPRKKKKKNNKNVIAGRRHVVIHSQTAQEYILDSGTRESGEVWQNLIDRDVDTTLGLLDKMRSKFSKLFDQFVVAEETSPERMFREIMEEHLLERRQAANMAEESAYMERITKRCARNLPMPFVDENSREHKRTGKRGHSVAWAMDIEQSDKTPLKQNGHLVDVEKSVHDKLISSKTGQSNNGHTPGHPDAWIVNESTSNL